MSNTPTAEPLALLIKEKSNNSHSNIVGSCCQKTDFEHANNKGIDQPVHMHSLISTIFIHKLGKIKAKLDRCEISVYWPAFVAFVNVLKFQTQISFCFQIKCCVRS